MNNAALLTPPQDQTEPLTTISLLGDEFYAIHNYDQMPPFFMSLVSASDHWLFVSSSGSLSAGRVDAEKALFPYYTEDKLTENSENTGPKTILWVRRGAGEKVRWEPFSPYGDQGGIERHIYKNTLGSTLIFEEINTRLGLRIRAVWRTGDRFGFVRSVYLTNLEGSPAEIEVLDGLQNLLPAGATTKITNELSLLLDAYKLANLDAETGLGAFALNASLSDRAEASECLRATTVWSTPLPQPTYLLSSEQVNAFRQGRPISQESEMRGRRGAYFVHSAFELGANAEQVWHLVAEVSQDSAQVADLRAWLRSSSAAEKEAALADDLAQNATDLRALLASVDGFQATGDAPASGRHLANTLYNTMRGGLFADGDTVHAADLRAFAKVRNREVLARHADFFDSLPDTLSVADLNARAAETSVPDLIRLCAGYLPLTFSRRHGDPSRPWNRFAIKVKRPDGSRNLDYQGNWRDIFQNWEPLAYSHPAFLPNMLATFLNATTADGYNPYRVTRDGLEWEEPEPENPWANIGYWSDHQINYLVKLLEVSEALTPGRLSGTLNERTFSHALVPYQIKPYREMLRDPSQTIDFNHDLNAEIHARVGEMGTDGRLLRGPDGQILHVSLLEKLLTLLLAKLVNLVPEGGLWMNTQRPEWNDANNALVGKGLSVVTVAYLRRYLVLLGDLLEETQGDLTLTRETAGWLDSVGDALGSFQSEVEKGWTDGSRRAFMEVMGAAGTDYRKNLYASGLSGESAPVSRERVRELLNSAEQYVEQILRVNRRPDGLFHSYNLLSVEGEEAHVGYLSAMLEGQVAILSSGLLNPAEALGVLQALRNSDLYCPKRNTYLLYPDHAVKSFFEKNRVRAEQVKGLRLIELLEARHDARLLRRDSQGDYHFGGDFRNAGDLSALLDTLEQEAELADAVREARKPLLALFEQTFNHAAFTGRSGTFFAFEGLGSVYWHMVSKLLLAAQEQVLAAQKENSSDTAALIAAYRDIRGGLSFNRSAEQYGAFPTDPYSHTPAHGGAKQPGMTGQVKEELLTRPAELGLRVHGGTLHFDPLLIHEREWLPEPQTLRYLDVHGDWQELELPAGSLALTWGQVPVTVSRGEQDGLTVHWQGGDSTFYPNLTLDPAIAQHLFAHDGQVQRLSVNFSR